MTSGLADKGAALRRRGGMGSVSLRENGLPAHDGRPWAETQRCESRPDAHLVRGSFLSGGRGGSLRAGASHSAERRAGWAGWAQAGGVGLHLSGPGAPGAVGAGRQWTRVGSVSPPTACLELAGLLTEVSMSPRCRCGIGRSDPPTSLQRPGLLERTQPWFSPFHKVTGKLGALQGSAQLLPGTSCIFLPEDRRN